MDTNFYALVRKRIAEHSDRAMARLVIPHHKKSLTNTQRHNKWLQGFEKRYGMTYAVYKNKVQAGEIQPMSKTNNRFPRQEGAIVEITETPKIQPETSQITIQPEMQVTAEKVSLAEPTDTLKID